VINVRLRLLRLLRSPLLVFMQLVRAALPAALSLAVGRLLAAPATTTAILVAGLFFTDQLVWLVINPVRFRVVRRIDGQVRARVRLRAAGLRGLDQLESRAFQDRAARAVDAGMGMARDRSVGAAAVGQLELLARIVSAVAAAAVVATFSIPLAALLLGVALWLRSVVRRQWMAIVDRLDADTAGQRHEYYISDQAVIGAAKDVRLFGLSDWFAGRFRAAAIRTYAPVWRAILTTLRGQWWIAGVLVAAAAAAMAIPAAAVMRGDLDASRLATLVLAAFGTLAISRMGMEAFDIEYGVRGLEAADELPGTPAARSKARSDEAEDVRFDAVTFTYPGATTPVLDDLIVTIRAGETVAVVGENGAGKTTFVKLWPACTPRTAAGSPSVAWTRASGGPRSRPCSRTSCTTRPRCGTTSPPECRRPTARSGTRCSGPGRRICRWTPTCGAKAGTTCPAGSGSGSRWPGSCTPARKF
jgi:ATP-binding cassette subfamily B protein